MEEIRESLFTSQNYFSSYSEEFPRLYVGNYMKTSKSFRKKINVFKLVIIQISPKVLIVEWNFWKTSFLSAIC